MYLGSYSISPVGDLPCEPLRRKPRAIAISPAPNRSCYTAGITNLLGPKRSVVVGLFKSPNRLRWLAHRVIALSELNLAMRFGGVVLSAEFRT